MSRRPEAAFGIRAAAGEDAEIEVLSAYPALSRKVARGEGLR